MTDYELEELETQINKACWVPVFKNGANIGYRIESDPRRIAEHLDYQGYRKEEVVAKEIFDKLMEVSKNFGGALPIWALKAWAIEFGIEVEE